MSKVLLELCDVYDESGTRTGRIVARGTKLLHGEYYLVVQVWIQNDTNQYLVQKRARHLASGPGIWATTAGYVLAGEDSISGTIREVKEELGLQLSPAHLKRFDRLKMDNLIQDLWLVKVSAKVSKHLIGVPTPGIDVADWMWSSKAELEQMVRRGDFFAYSYLSTLPE